MVVFIALVAGFAIGAAIESIIEWRDLKRWDRCFTNGSNKKLKQLQLHLAGKFFISLLFAVWILWPKK